MNPLKINNFFYIFGLCALKNAHHKDFLLNDLNWVIAQLQIYSKGKTKKQGAVVDRYGR